MQNRIILTVFLALLLGFGCGDPANDSQDQEHKDHEHAGETTHDHHEEAAEDEVHLAGPQIKMMGIELGRFRNISLSSVVKANGELKLPPQGQASVSTMMGGRIKDIYVIEGDRVKKGQTLALLEHPDFVEMQEEYLSVRSRLNYLEKEYERKKGLYADSISSARNFQEVEAEYEAALTRVNSLKSKLRMLNIDPSAIENGQILQTIPVQSPIRGFVRFVKVNIGKFAEPQQELFEIIDNDHIHIDLMIYEKDINKVREGQKVIFSPVNKPDSLLEGRIFAVGKAFENDPKAVHIHADIENKTGNLLPGTYIEARIVTEEKKTIALPDEAIVSDGGLNYIFVLQPGVHDHHADEQEYNFKKVEVHTGVSDIGFTEVVPVIKLSGKEQVVTKGAFYLLAEMKKGEVGHGHSH